MADDDETAAAAAAAAAGAAAGAAFGTSGIDLSGPTTNTVKETTATGTTVKPDDK